MTQTEHGESAWPPISEQFFSLCSEKKMPLLSALTSVQDIQVISS